MKVTIVQFILAIAFTCVALASHVNAQILDRKISVGIEGVEIREALLQIQKEADVKFVYSSTAIPVKQRVSVRASATTLREVLDKMLTPYAIRYEVVNNRILLFKDNSNGTAEVSNEADPTAATESVQMITGVITDKEGQPIPGVNIVIKGTTRGTTTDVSGKYSINANEGDVLVFSFIGYKTVEIEVKTQTSMSVSMESDISTLSEVVVTGYQEIKKESFTGSTITVTGEDIQKINPLNLLQSLQAYDPSFRVIQDNAFGSNPNKIPEINVRGTTGIPLDKNSLTSNPNLPTFILDGFQVTLQTIYDLDVNRIETVTFLKDAAATAIYGSRAANGVLVITTKAPKEGQLQFSYNYNLSVTGPDLSVYHVLDAKDKLEYERLAGVYDPTLNQLYAPRDLEKLYYSKLSNVVAGVDTYWLSEPVQTAVEQQNSLMVEGGSGSMRYALTARQQTLKGVMKGSDRKRIGADVRLSYNLKDKFYFTNILTVSKVEATESPYGNFADYVKMNPYYIKRDENGNVLREIDSWKRRGANDAGEDVLFNDVILNPLYDAKLSSFNTNEYTQLINSFSTTWNITKGLSLRGLLSLTQYTSENNIFKSPLRNEYYFYSTKDLNKRGEYNYSTSNQTTIDGNMVLSYTRSLGEHLINGSVGANVRDYTSNNKGFTAIGFTNDRFDNIGFANSYRENDSPSGGVDVERLVGALASFNYSYANKYLFDLSGRVDGSSKFGAESRYAPFWAAGIGWNAHNESNITLPEKITLLRLRATTGWTGGISFPPYMSKTTYDYYSDWYSTGVGVHYMSYGNEDLKWQRTQNYELGLETNYSTWLNLSARYYYKLTKDLVTDIIVPPSLGFSSYKDNLGELENQGYEFNIRAEVFRNKDWAVSVNANMAHNQNVIKKISESLKKYNDDADGSQGTTPQLRYNEGQSLNAIYAVESLGIDPENGKEIYVKKDGTLTYDYDVKDTRPMGDNTPTLDGFFGSTISYKRFILNVSFYTRFGGDFYNQTLVDRVENADVRFNVDSRALSRRWKQPGDVAFFKDIKALNATSTVLPTSRFIQSDNVVELRSVNLMYEPARAFTQKLHMQFLRFGLVMNDIARWSAVRTERGIEYPFSRTVTFTVQTRF